jgi:hypothetical protein
MRPDFRLAAGRATLPQAKRRTLKMFMTRPLAEGILALDFPEADAARICVLNLKANDGALTADEEPELEAYVNVCDLLAYWHSRARQTLQ